MRKEIDEAKNFETVRKERNELTELQEHTYWEFIRYFIRLN